MDRKKKYKKFAVLVFCIIGGGYLLLRFLFGQPFMLEKSQMLFKHGWFADAVLTACEKGIGLSLKYVDSFESFQNQLVKAFDLEEQETELSFISQKITSDTERKKVEQSLRDYPDCGVWLRFYDGWGMESQAIVDLLQLRWERNHTQEGMHIGVYFDEKAITQNMDNISQTLPFSTIAGAQWEHIIREAIAQEKGVLWFIQYLRIGELDCCIFEILPDNSYSLENEAVYHVIVEGKWEGESVPIQHLKIPEANTMWRIGIEDKDYFVKEDINFDGYPDLLIPAGYSGGSGGSWQNNRAIVWNPQNKTFEYFPSFPVQILKMELDRKRLVSRGRLGIKYEYVEIYEIVNGEFMCTQKLELHGEMNPNKAGLDYTLYYYKMGKLIQTHPLKDRDEEELESLYPDLNYWLKG